MKSISGFLRSILDWLHSEFRHTANNFMRDMRSMRALFNYIFLLLYIFLCVWAALYHAKDSLNTAIAVTGGIVSSIFTVYVWSTTKEKMAKRALMPAPASDAPQPASDSEDGGSD